MCDKNFCYRTKGSKSIIIQGFVECPEDKYIKCLINVQIFKGNWTRIMDEIKGVFSSHYPSPVTGDDLAANTGWKINRTNEK